MCRCQRDRLWGQTGKPVSHRASQRCASVGLSPLPWLPLPPPTSLGPGRLHLRAPLGTTQPQVCACSPHGPPAAQRSQLLCLRAEPAQVLCLHARSIIPSYFTSSKIKILRISRWQQQSIKLSMVSLQRALHGCTGQTPCSQSCSWTK